MLLAVDVISHELCSQAVAERLPAPVIIEVTNSHFTMGRVISGDYLKVLGDGTVECHTLKFTGKEVDVVKKKQLTPNEVREFKVILDQAELLGARQRYGLTRGVFDSWMEWNIRIPRAVTVQNISIAGFARTPLKEGSYPNAVLKLGCSISRLRDEVYGDEPDWRRSECKNILSAK
jgi:hypothetical protein